MRCNKPFMSQGNHNRICWWCKDTDDWRYGNELIYPVCQQAKRFAILTGQKTLSDGAIFQIKRLGYSVKEYINREL